MLDHIVYDSFGNIVTETDAANGDRFKFAGMQYDATTGQYYDHARWYSPAIGRFAVTRSRRIWRRGYGRFSGTWVITR